MKENQFGKVSILSLEASSQKGKTVLSDVHFTAPYKIMQPFLLPDGGIQVMLLAASAGIMEGDRQKFSFHILPGAKVEFLSQSYDKIHPMDSGDAKRETKIMVASGGSFCFHPQPTIPFAGSAFENRMEIELEDETAVFQMCEILTCGRYARGERFAYRSFRNYVEIRRGGRLIYRDNTWYEPELFPMEETGMMEEFTHQANLFVTKPEDGETFCEEVRNLLEDERKNCQGGITRLAEGDYAVRLFGWRGQVLEELSNKILGLLRKNPV